MKFANEQIEKAKSAKSADELIALAQEIGIELTEEEAKNHFEQWHKEGELADEELDNVAGGCGTEKKDVEVRADWDPTGFGCTSFSSCTSNPYPKCGRCIYFYPTSDCNWGICKHESDD